MKADRKCRKKYKVLKRGNHEHEKISWIISTKILVGSNLGAVKDQETWAEIIKANYVH